MPGKGYARVTRMMTRALVVVVALTGVSTVGACSLISSFDGLSGPVTAAEGQHDVGGAGMGVWRTGLSWM